MKPRNIAVVATLILVPVVLSQEPTEFSVKKNKVAGTGTLPSGMKAPDAEFRIKSSTNDSSVPDLVIPAYSTGQSRVCDVRITKGRTEVAIQFDEFNIKYFDYKLEDGLWKLEKEQKICNLTGSLARRLAQVDILAEGVVVVGYLKESSSNPKSGWSAGLINKDHKNDDLTSERYVLTEDGFRLDGEPALVRPKSRVGPVLEKPETNSPAGENAETRKPAR